MISKDSKVEDLEISVRSVKGLESAGIMTVGDLLKCDEARLLKIRHFGRRCLREIIEQLEEHGLQLGVPIISATHRVSDKMLHNIVRGWEASPHNDGSRRPSDKVAMAVELLATRAMIRRRL